MTPAHFDTFRRSLGLSKREVATLARKVDERTVSRWQSGTTPIPRDAIDALYALEDRMELTMGRILQMVTDRSLAGPVPLHRYRTQADLDDSPHAGLPLGAHAMMTAWTYDALEAEGVDVDIVWAD